MGNPCSDLYLQSSSGPADLTHQLHGSLSAGRLKSRLRPCSPLIFRGRRWTRSENLVPLRAAICIRNHAKVASLKSCSSRVRIYQLIVQLASTPTTVLITGESGTGKELVARAIHARSGRASHPFVAINVAAIPDALVESELFGHEKGAFTGAIAKKLGRFELAHGGTIFLDEIGSLRLDLQTKLLRALQEREIERLGGVRAIPVDVRIVAATNVNLKDAVRARAFREDLYYRLNVVPIHVPPLRERREDIGPLAQYFVRKIARECGRDVRGVSGGALEVLTRYDWPGNVRELENVLHRAVVLTQSQVIHLQDVPLDVAMPGTGSRVGEDTGPPLRDALEQFERQYILRVLEGVGWNVSHAARRLGVHRNTVLTKLSAWRIQRPGSEGRSLGL
jgi:transcriptional regulator with PAS, ATPase and Fis domain